MGSLPARAITVAALQLSSQDDLDANLASVAELTARAAQREAELVLLPENFAFMGSEEDRRSIAETIVKDPSEGDGPILCALRTLAREHRVHIVAGGFPEASGDRDRPFNTSAVIDPTGSVVASYRKIHLFDVDVGDGHVYRESASASPGDRAVVASVAGVKLGLTVCYDLRFPELFRVLAERGADITTVPAAFTLMTGKDHWHVLLRARAIESQVFVLAAAQCGTHPRGRRTYGKSCVIDPWGDVVAQASEGVGMAVATLDLARLQAVRSSLPSMKHRRPFS